jgi:hypothetical protein
MSHALRGGAKKGETKMRDFNAMLIAPVMRLTGFRFSKEYRWGVSRFHRAVYAMVNTVRANISAGM